MKEMLNCVDCGEPYPAGRFFVMRGDAMRRVRCPDCADALPPPLRTIAPMHKSNYTLITNRSDLAGLNNKGGLVK